MILFSSLSKHGATAAILLSVAFSLTAGAADVFWLEHTISGKQYGPVRNVPGFRILIGNESITVMESPAGRIRFASSVDSSGYGPYKLENSRIIKLGGNAFSIVNLGPEADPRPPAPARVPVPAAPAAAPQQQPPADAAPVRKPFLSKLWIELFNSTKYDWKLGGFSGNTGADLERMAFGVSAEWSGLFISAGFTSGAELSSDIVPTGVSVSKITLENGSGFYLNGGYTHSIQLDNRWRALLTGALTYRDEDYDLAVSSLHPVEAPAGDSAQVSTYVIETGADAESTEPIESPEPVEGKRASRSKAAADAGASSAKSYEYRDDSSGASVSDLSLLAAGGIEYDGDFWGARAEVSITLFNDVSTSGTASIAGSQYSIEAEQSHPVSVSAAAWCYIIEDVRAETAVSFGAETALRLALGIHW